MWNALFPDLCLSVCDSVTQHPGPGALLLCLEIAQLRFDEALLPDGLRPGGAVVAIAAAGVTTTAFRSHFSFRGGGASRAEARLVAAALIGGMGEADIAIHEGEIGRDDEALSRGTAIRAAGGMVAFFDAAVEFEFTAFLAGVVVDGHGEEGSWFAVRALFDSRWHLRAPRMGLWGSQGWEWVVFEVRFFLS